MWAHVGSLQQLVQQSSQDQVAPSVPAFQGAELELARRAGVFVWGVSVCCGKVRLAVMGAELQLLASEKCSYTGRHSLLGVVPPSTRAGRWKVPSLSFLRKPSKPPAGEEGKGELR